MRQTAKEVFGVTTILGMVGVVAFGITSCMGNTDTGSSCLNSFQATYSYGYKLEELDAIWADQKITVKECSQVSKIYNALEEIQQKEAVDGRIKQYRNGFKQTA